MPNDQHVTGRAPRGWLLGSLGAVVAAHLRSPASFFGASASSLTVVSTCSAVMGRG